MRLLLFLLAFTFGCEQNLRRDDSCSLQGFNHLSSKRISCKNDLVISTVEFSNGISRKLIQGSIKLKNQKYPFTIVVDSTTVVQHVFPLKEMDTSNYDCTIKYVSSNKIEIQWKKENNRLFLRKEFTSVN